MLIRVAGPIVAALFSVSAALAAVYELNSGLVFGTTLGPGTGRGIGLRADAATTISSIGIEGAIALGSYDVLVWSSIDGNQLIAPLAVETAVAGGGGFGFHDIPINFTFVAGQYYALQWRPSIPINFWDTSPGLQYYEDSALPRVVGPFTLINGFEGHSAANAEFSNTLHANLRVDVEEAVAVPEPSSTWSAAGGILVVLGWAVLGWLRRFRPGFPAASH